MKFWIFCYFELLKQRKRVLLRRDERHRGMKSKAQGL